MASQINSTNIDVTYPIAGQDNDTQGFRTNFLNIRNNFSTAKTEITNLQSNVDVAPKISTVPTTLTASGTPGQIAYNGNYLYVCYTYDQWMAVPNVGTSTSNVTSTQLSTSGNLSVGGNATIASNLTVSGNLVISQGVVDKGYFLANVETDQNLIANVNYHKFVANASPATTIANLWITLPSVAKDGSELKITSLTPITSCFINQAGTEVHWVANSWASSGNVSVTMTYNATTSKWMQF